MRNHWALSKLAKYMRRRAGIVDLTCGSMDEWDAYEIHAKETAPFTNWLTNTGFSAVQDFAEYFDPRQWVYAYRASPIVHFIRNVWTFRKSISRYRAWDQSGLLSFMEEATADMAYLHRHNGHLLRSKHTARQLEVFSHLMSRLRADEYSDRYFDHILGKSGGIFGGKLVPNTNLGPIYGTKSFYKMTNGHRKNDLDLAASLFTKNVQSWWD